MHTNEYCVHFDTEVRAVELMPVCKQIDSDTGGYWCCAEIRRPLHELTLSNTSPMDFRYPSYKAVKKFNDLFEAIKHKVEHENAANNNRLGQNTKTWIAFYHYMKNKKYMQNGHRHASSVFTSPDVITEVLGDFFAQS